MEYGSGDKCAGTHGDSCRGGSVGAAGSIFDPIAGQAVIVDTARTEKWKN